MSADDACAEIDELQFDRVVSDTPPGEQTGQRPTVSCAGVLGHWFSGRTPALMSIR